MTSDILQHAPGRTETVARHRILVADPLHPSGLELLRGSGCEVHAMAAEERPDVSDLVRGCSALVVRSGTRVDAALLDAAGEQLRVVARAGIGVDNIDLEAATARGVLVVNAPAANLVSAAEHTMALLLALARRVPAAHASLTAGEWRRKQFLGTELHGKLMGIVGLGRIGQRVAERSRAFGLRLVAHDPFLDAAAAARLDVELTPLPELLSRADVVSLHVPLTERTRGMLGSAELAAMKRGALLVNCARGGLVDEAALLEALESGQIGGAALDVFAEEPPTDLALARHPRVVATPHLGAQTGEAQERAAVETARQVLAALEGSLAVSAVNLPFRWSSDRGEPWLRLGDRLGAFAASLLDSPLRRVECELQGMSEDLLVPLSVAAVRGALGPTLGSSVNYVNAAELAAERGVEVVRRARVAGDALPQVRLVVTADDRQVDVTGTLVGHERLRVIRFGDTPLEFQPAGRLLVLRTVDRPGVVGAVGELLGKADLNIADIHLARRDGEAEAWTVLRLDQEPGPDVLERLAELPEAREVRLIDLG